MHLAIKDRIYFPVSKFYEENIEKFNKLILDRNLYAFSFLVSKNEIKLYKIICKNKLNKFKYFNLLNVKLNFLGRATCRLLLEKYYKFLNNDVIKIILKYCFFNFEEVINLIDALTKDKITNDK